MKNLLATSMALGLALALGAVFSEPARADSLGHVIQHAVGIPDVYPSATYVNPYTNYGYGVSTYPVVVPYGGYGGYGGYSGYGGYGGYGHHVGLHDLFGGGHGGGHFW